MHDEFTDRLELGRNCPTEGPASDLQFCREHKLELVEGKSAKRKAGAKYDLPIKPFHAPVPVGGKGFLTPTRTASKGNSNDRGVHRHILTFLM